MGKMPVHIIQQAIVGSTGIHDVTPARYGG